MTALDLPRSLAQFRWLRWPSGVLRRFAAALFRPRPDPRALSPHMRRDIGLIDTAPLDRQP